MIALPCNEAGWLRFNRLDSLQGINQVYAMGWRFTDEAGLSDPWSQRLTLFKRGRDVLPAIVAFNLAVNDLVRAVGWSAHETGVIPALSSNDTCTNPSKQIPKLAQSCAHAMGFTYLPHVITKKAHRPLRTLNSLVERRNEVREADYKANLEGCSHIRRILIVDDLVTNGDTMSAIARAIHAHVPDMEFYGLALGKNEKQGYAHSHGHQINNGHVPHSWAEAWDNAR